MSDGELILHHIEILPATPEDGRKIDYWFNYGTEDVVLEDRGRIIAWRVTSTPPDEECEEGYSHVAPLTQGHNRHSHFGWVHATRREDGVTVYALRNDSTGTDRELPLGDITDLGWLKARIEDRVHRNALAWAEREKAEKAKSPATSPNVVNIGSRVN